MTRLHPLHGHTSHKACHLAPGSTYSSSPSAFSDWSARQTQYARLACMGNMAGMASGRRSLRPSGQVIWPWHAQGYALLGIEPWYCALFTPHMCTALCTKALLLDPPTVQLPGWRGTLCMLLRRVQCLQGVQGVQSQGGSGANKQATAGDNHTSSLGLGGGTPNHWEAPVHQSSTRSRKL